jgi:hypothetical protein
LIVLAALLYFAALNAETPPRSLVRVSSVLPPAGRARDARVLPRQTAVNQVGRRRRRLHAPPPVLSEPVPFDKHCDHIHSFVYREQGVPEAIPIVAVRAKEQLYFHILEEQATVWPSAPG